MSTQSSSFTVAFGKVARTLEYHDHSGRIRFTFDGGGKPSLVLEHHDIRHRRPPNYDEAFARSKQFLESCGYKVVFDELTQQFGVASPANVFHGFWGSFAQTLEALLAS